MPKIPTNEDFDAQLKSKHGEKFTRLEDRIPNQKKIKCKCNTCGRIWQAYIPSILSGIGCRQCLMVTKDEFDRRINDIFNGNYIRISELEIKGIHSQKITMHCKICDNSNIQSGKHILAGHGCWNCMRSKLIDSQRMTKEEFIDKSRQINGNKYTYENLEHIENQKTKVTITCSIHGCFNQLVTVHIYNKSGCPKCKESKGEKSIRVFLEENNIDYLQNKRFSDCRYKNTLPFDFYLEKYNLLIEFDGEQHESGFRIFRKKSKIVRVDKQESLNALNLQKIKDDIKTNYCILNNIKLLRIHYKDYKNIGSILSKTLNIT